MDDMSLMFLAVHQFDDGSSYRGAFLVTDSDTTPTEFRCTNAINPTQLQKTLYGNIIDEHILVELIAEPLFNACTKKPDIVIVTDDLLLSFRKKVSIPVAVLKEETELHVSEDDPTRGIITSESGKFQPVVTNVHNDFMEDKKLVAEMLTPILSKRSLTEPFERIRIALGQVHDKDLA